VLLPTLREDGPAVPDDLLTLDNCDQEPIHIPGQIQSHGALFAFDPSGTLMYRSTNVEALLGPGLPSLGDSLSVAQLARYPGLEDLLAQVRDAPDDDVFGHAAEIHGDSGSFNVVAHRTARGLICEFESGLNAVPETAAFSFSAHRAIERLRRQSTVDELLGAAVQEVRRLTGFDRVMAYRFLHDDSGSVVAESRDASLEPFLGARYPAGDIPAQARRLYVVNTLRLIADVRSLPVPVQALRTTTEPLDMSHGVLRSVSPVHIEYLTNMGVAASMSISIVIGGRLWGMLACHHMQPLRVSYPVRMACDVLGQLLAANLQGILARARATRSEAAANFRSHLLAQVFSAQDLGSALSVEAGAICESFGAQGLLLADGGKLEVFASLDPTAAAALLQWLNGEKPVAGHMVHRSALDALPATLRQQLGVWCGFLALPFGADPLNWIVLLRKEQLETVIWGGRPEKVYAIGPLGARLTPRGSFALWRETVKGHALAWDETDMESAQKLLDKLLWADAARMAEMERSRNHLMTMLGHDLRDPLQSITNTATLLALQGGNANLSQRIKASSSRMQRLIGHVMDISRLKSGGLNLQMESIDLTAVVRDLVAESNAARPGVKIQPILPPKLKALADRDRIAQVLGNLLGNASHYATPGSPVLVKLLKRDGMAVIEVSNEGRAPSDEVVATLFQPFRRGVATCETNRNGLGLGLYIAQQVMAGHAGTLTYCYEEPYVIFTASFPLNQDRAGRD
jgi:chemotaxis family two-component system sensor kinase Cph1